MTPSFFFRLLLIGLVSSAAIGAAGCGGHTEAETPAAEPAVPVRTTVVETRDLTETLTLTGTLDPRARVAVVSEVSARLLRVLPAEGDHVDKDAVLATLDDIDFRLARDRAKAALDLAEANRTHAKAEEERAESLVKTGGITDKDRLAAQVAVQVREAAAAQARTELAIAEQQLTRSVIKAPVAGRVSKRMVDPGAFLTAGRPIFDIVDESVLEFRASVPSADFGKVHVGADVKVTVDALPGFETKGRVDRIAPVVDARSRSFEVIVLIPGQRQLIPGLFARADIRVRNVPGSLTVPSAALVRDGGDPSRASAFVVSGGKAERRDVMVGIERPDAVQVTSGLRAGEAVVVDPPASLASGTHVDVQNQKAGS